MMGALDQKYEMAIAAMRREARRRGFSFKEMIVRIASDGNLIKIPLWNDEFDARLIRLSKGGDA
ncbi:hypothetical protein [Mesorhizobium amorphae]|uniref:hypothetical protein n=1 Tax=Mesorhizobium amorphae TaxID=71433 RepID=UPI0011844816|nr:hypothetical protein [Mesorhizobium amorphae]